MCTIIGIIVQCVLATTPLTPAEAAVILAPYQYVHVPQVLPQVHIPRTGVFVLRSSSTAGPFGEFLPFPPPRRLDGTLLSQPVTVYGEWHSWTTQTRRERAGRATMVMGR